ERKVGERESVRCPREEDSRPRVKGGMWPAEPAEPGEPQVAFALAPLRTPPATRLSPIGDVARPPAPPPVPTRSASPRAPRRAPQHSVAQRAAAAQELIRREPWLQRILNDTPAWLISMLVHLIAITLLALFTTSDDGDEAPFITLSMVAAREANGGGETVIIPPEDQAQFDLPLPVEADLDDPRQREVLVAAAQDARELRLEETVPYLPNVELVKQQVGRADGVSQALLARDPRLRVEVVAREGGTTLTEAAVARGLRWLANHQNEDGSWSLHGFRRAGDCNCGGDGAYHQKSPGTALALLPFLGAGQTHLAGRYQGNVSRGLRWLIEHQKENGDLRAGANGNEGMYTHGQAAIVLCEAFAMTGDEALRVPAQKAIDFIVLAQYRDGGWRYQPSPKSQRGDTSVVGWQLMALQSARSANLTVPDETWGMADLFLDSVADSSGARYAYQANNRSTPVMTAEALLCRVYLGWAKDRPALGEGIDWLIEDHLPSEQQPNIYYWYYGTQLMHHYGGEPWEKWNLEMRDILCQSQETRGHAAGSWVPRGDHAGAGGRIYVTALAICSLEVYYRHLPIFRQLELER
ncbi:MAG: terpene cyclase/mutase family protein, partial [Pirellulaceae bacterium]|nr:terpene cyclase/mutase family protein [Pirellulaceae bacterium]